MGETTTTADTPISAADTPAIAAKPAGARRPIKARDSAWAARVTAWLVARGVTPNAISLFSIACGCVAGGALLATNFVASPFGRALFFVLAIAGIQARLLCNLFDGMVAVEGGRAGKAGDVFNDFPDRIADPLILIGAGFAAGGAWGVSLGWCAALLAVLTAYVRVLGRSLGTPTYFLGPMAKQHRMAVLSVACVFATILSFWTLHRPAILIALIVINAGCVLTVARRTARIIADLEHRP